MGQCRRRLIRYEHMFENEELRNVPGTLDGLDDIEPGWALGMWLSRIDLDHLSGHDRVVVLRAHQRMASHYTAQAYGAMAAVSDAMHEIDDDYELADEAAAAEIRVALRLTRRAAHTELDLALALRRRLPRVWALLASGEIDARRARLIVHATRHLSIATARQVVEHVIDDAPGLTTGQLHARIRRLSIDADPASARDRHDQAVAGRRVMSEPTPDGTAHLFGLDLPPDRVAAITARLNQLARSLRTGGELRTMDQLRADVFVDLLTGTAEPARGAGAVDLHADLSTLAELDDHGGELDPTRGRAPSVLGDEPSAGELESGLLPGGSEARERLQVAMLSSAAVDPIWQSSQVLGAQSSGGQGFPAKKKGSWLKRKWWIPVVGGLVLGVALSGDDGDNNLDDEED